jgi:uncharacterized integral membrane protein
MRNLKIITASILAILVVIIVVQNREPIATHLLFATLVMPHAVLLFITAGTGFRTWSSPRTVGKYKVQRAVKFPEPPGNLAPPARNLVYTSLSILHVFKAA